MSFTSSPLHDTIGAFSIKALIAEVTLFISHGLPLIICYFVMAMLAITPRTRIIRLALFPFIVLLTLRAAARIDLSLSITERILYHCLVLWMFATTARALGWALARKPFVRQHRPPNSTPSTLMDALDLFSNLRGYGWDWAKRVHIPRGTRPSNHTRFILHTVLSAAANMFVSNILHVAIGSCYPVELGNTSGGSIFDESLPSYLRFLRSSVITILVAACTYVHLQAYYDLCTIVGVLILGQDQTQWPPVFDAPWRATSLTEFWGRRWHQMLRRILLVLGGYPLSVIFGRAGMVMGAFLASAVCHHILLIVFTGNSELWRMVVGFGMMAPGILIEDLLKYVTGRKVQGFAGWVWTMGWLLWWGSTIADGWRRAHLFGLPTLIDLVPPVRMLVEYPVTRFDNFLHAIA